MQMRLLILFAVLIIYFAAVQGGRKTSGGRSSSRSGTRTRIISKASRGFRGYRSFRPKISKSRSRILFPTLGALGGIYIASRMRPHVHLRSYDDFDRVTVCPGFRQGFDPNTGTPRNYTYFVCPDDPDSLWDVHCCLDDATSLGFCCRSGTSRAASYGSGFATFAGVVIVALLIYFCCCRRRKQQKQVEFNQPSPEMQPFDSGVNPPYPTEPPLQSFPMPPPSPLPSTALVMPEPAPTPAPLPPMGSAWGSQVAQNDPKQRAPRDTPPPPYPGYAPTSTFPVEPSAPYPADSKA